MHRAWFCVFSVLGAIANALIGAATDNRSPARHPGDIGIEKDPA